MSQKRILLATDVPFWRNSTGAECRINSLCRFLATLLEVEVFFVGALSESDSNIIHALTSVEVRQVTSDQPPETTLNRLKWYAKATLNQTSRWLDSAKLDDSDNQIPRLADFRWPWAIERFAEAVDRFKPDFVLIEYIKLAYLLEALSKKQRQQVKCLIDTHDVLSSRYEQFSKFGYPHWIATSEQEEIAALQPFDLILAIQPEEAKWFSQRVPQAKTIVAGHSLDGQAIRKSNPDAARTNFVVGYLGSDNHSNFNAIQNFIEIGWPLVAQASHIECQLMVCGSICRSLQATFDTLPESIQLVPELTGLQNFYEQVDIVINPVAFGTGLKIKNCEALYFGRTLVTTPAGYAGMPIKLSDAIIVADDCQKMGLAILDLLEKPDRIHQMGNLAFELAHSEFSDEQAYSELKSWLQRRI